MSPRKLPCSCPTPQALEGTDNPPRSPHPVLPLDPPPPLDVLVSLMRMLPAPRQRLPPMPPEPPCCRPFPAGRQAAAHCSLTSRGCEKEDKPPGVGSAEGEREEGSTRGREDQRSLQQRLTGPVPGSPGWGRGWVDAEGGCAGLGWGQGGNGWGGSGPRLVPQRSLVPSPKDAAPPVASEVPPPASSPGLFFTAGWILCLPPFPASSCLSVGPSPPPTPNG